MIATIQDLSTFGRCSIAVALPTISAMGVQCCPIPTAVYSTHTGGLGEVSKLSLSELIPPILEQYKSLNLEFSGILTGYLGATDQFKYCSDFFETYNKALKVVDPVMGDGGKIYKAYTGEMGDMMKELVKKADLITPNLTEACMLLDASYPNEAPSLDFVIDLAKKLSDYAEADCLITGVQIENSKELHSIYAEKSGDMFMVTTPKVDASYPGTGDLFCAALTAGLCSGLTKQEATVLASSYTTSAVHLTYEAKTDIRFGVIFEPLLKDLYSGNFRIKAELKTLMKH